jgi:hypothetical protein
MESKPNLPQLLGLFELDENGKVLYSSFQSAEGPMLRQAGLDGVDFFQDIASFSNVGEFHSRFEFFRLAEARSSSFTFTCQYPDGEHLVKIVMARLMTETGPTSFLVHFRKP